METYRASTYGDRIAGAYDELYDALFDKDATVSFLAEQAHGGPALELGIGTGRIALPLAAEGIRIEGIDSSQAMVSRLRAKEGGGDIPVTIDDFARFELGRRFRLIFVVFNTFFALLTQADQIQCFQRVEEHLRDDGIFVLEAFVPDLSRFDRHQRVQATRVSVNEVELGVDRHDPVGQRVESQHVVVGESGIRMYPVQIRYAWPSELDLMARLASLTLAERWAGWHKERFTSDSTAHVSVYRRA